MSLQSFITYNAFFIISALVSLGVGIFILYYVREHKDDILARKYKILLSAGIILTFVVPGILVYYSWARWGKRSINIETMCYARVAPENVSFTPALLSIRKKSKKKFQDLLE